MVRKVYRAEEAVLKQSFDRTRPDAGWVDGKLKACRYCGGPLPKGRRTFCSGDRARFRRVKGVLRQYGGTGCVHLFCIEAQPAYARKCVESRDQRVCALCGKKASSSDGWQMDHTVPVCEGGGLAGLDGLRTLCKEDHLKVTRELRARLAAKRAAERAGEVRR